MGRNATLKAVTDAVAGMTTVAVLAAPPFEGCVLEDLVASTDLTDSEAVTLYEAMLGDVAAAVDESGASLLVNYAPREHLPDHVPEDAAPKTALESVVADAVADPDAIRYEVQVGSTEAARIGNTVTHLLEREDESSVHVVRPTVPTLTRQLVDTASMKLRRMPVVVGPSTEGRVYYAAFSETLDFEGAYDAPALQTLVGRALDAGHEVDFIQQLTPVETAGDLASLVPLVESRSAAGRIVPDRTLAAIDELGLGVTPGEDGLALSRS